MAGIENSVASMVPSCSAWKISPACRSCVATPSFCITMAPSPKKRIFRPLRSSSVLISLRNQPDASGAIEPHSMASTLYLRGSSCISLLAAAVAHPAEVFAHLRPERHRGEHREGDVLAGEEAEAGPGRVERAGRDRVEVLARRNQRARLEEAHVDRAGGHLLDRSAKAICPGPRIAIAPGKAPAMFMRTRLSCASAASSNADR